MELIRRMFWGRNIREVLNETISFRIQGVKFVIKKIDPLAHLDGSKVMLQKYAEYEKKKDSSAIGPGEIKAMREHYRDIFLASVVQPKICRKPEEAAGDVIPVDHLLTDWKMSEELYLRVVAYSYGKKKIPRSILPAQDL